LRSRPAGDRRQTLKKEDMGMGMNAERKGKEEKKGKD
jgi:hypothetical protein